MRVPIRRPAVSFDCQARLQRIYMRVGRSCIGESRLLFILFAILLAVPAAYSLTNGNDGKKSSKTTRPRKLGESISTLRRDPKTGRLISASAGSDSTSYVEKADAQAAIPADDEITLDSKLFAF